MSRMISSDQRSPNISTEAFRGHCERRFTLRLGIFSSKHHLHLTSNIYIMPRATDFLNQKRRATMQLNPYLHFNGQCEAAFKFYEQCLGGKIEAMVSHEGTPVADQVPAEWRSKIVHARLLVGGQ